MDRLLCRYETKRTLSLLVEGCGSKIVANSCCAKSYYFERFFHEVVTWSSMHFLLLCYIKQTPCFRQSCKACGKKNTSILLHIQRNMQHINTTECKWFQSDVICIHDAEVVGFFSFLFFTSPIPPWCQVCVVPCSLTLIMSFHVRLRSEGHLVPHV